MKRVSRRRDPSGHVVTVRDLEPGDWPVIERLFGERGACGGCWCMYWRVAGGKTWEQEKGTPNKAAFRKLVRSGLVRGCLAFADTEPVGWCNVGPRADFPRLQNSRVLQSKRDDAWAVVCFYVPAGWRGRGVASKLAHHAVGLAKREGARVLEAYPVRKRQDPTPAAFAWTGVPQLFERSGFQLVASASGTRPIYRKVFRRRR